MPLKRMGVLTNNLVTNIAVWDGVKAWDPGLEKTEIPTSIKFGDAAHARNGSYTYNVVIDGNSMAVGTAGGSSFVALNQAVLDAGLTQNDVVNMATNGFTTPQCTTRLATQIYPLYESALGTKNIYIFWEGINDLFAGSTDTQVYNNLKSHLQLLKNQGWKTICGTLTPRSGASGTQQTYRTNVNTLIRNAKAANESWLDAVADVGGDSSIGQSTSGTYYADGLHLNTAGSNVAKAYFTTALQGLL